MEVYTSQQEGGSGRSWSDRVDEEETWGQQSSRHHKRRWGASNYESDLWAALSFPFSDEVRVVACEKLFNEARAFMTANSQWVEMTLRHNIPVSECSDQGIAQLTNLLLIVVAEFHLMRSIRSCGPILLPEIKGQLRDLREYLPHNDTGYPSTEVHVKDKGNLMRLACWFHCLDMAFTYSSEIAQSLRRDDHLEIGGLLHYLGHLVSDSSLQQR